jgi:hypothetical protein
VEEVERKHNTFKLTETVKEDRKSGIMVVESEEGRDTLIHVLTNVFQVQDDHPLSLSLKQHGFHDIQAIVDASKTDIDALTYKDCQGSTVVDLPTNHKYMIRLLKSYHHSCSVWGIANDWKLLTARDFDDFVEQIGFEPASLRQVPSLQSTTPIRSTEATIAPEAPSKASIAPKTPSKDSIVLKAASKESIALQTPSKASVALKPAPMELIALETPPKAAIVLKSPSNAPMELDTPSKAPVVLETSSTASIILDMPSKICQDAHCSRNQVVTPDLMPEPSTPFSSFLLCHASNAAARLTSLLQPSPRPQMDVMAFDDEEEHTIVFGEMATTPSTLAPFVPNVTPLEMDFLPHPDDEQMIVFGTEMVTPVCLFPAIPSTAPSVSDSVYDSNCGLQSDNDPKLQLMDEASDDANGKDALIDVAPSLDTSHDAPPFWCHASYPILLVTLHGHFNTVHLLPPANGPPTPSLAAPDTAVEISYQLKDLLRALCFLDWQSEPHQYWSADDSKTRNLHLNPLRDEVSSPLIRYCPDSLHHGESKMPTIDLQGFQARIIMALDAYESKLGMQPEHICFRCSVKDGEFKVVLSYFQLMDSLESQEDGEGNIWKFHRITGHQDSLLSYDKDYNGSLCNVMIEWENGEITLEPLSLIAEVDPIMCASFPCVQEAIAATFIAMHHLLSFQGNMAQPYDED